MKISCLFYKIILKQSEIEQSSRFAVCLFGRTLINMSDYIFQIL